MMRNRDKIIRKIDASRLARLKPFLDEIAQKTEVEKYVSQDPVLFVHAFDAKQDRLLAGFFAALMAWGRRDIVIDKVDDLLQRMNYRPYQFILNYKETDRSVFHGFKHRTFKPVDIHWLTTILHRILLQYHDFEAFWRYCYLRADGDSRQLMACFPTCFFEMAPDTPERTYKHVASSAKNSACKRLWLFLRWTVRPHSVVDKPLMNFIKTSELMIPLDVHVARNARALGLLQRRYNDWKSVVELTRMLRRLDRDDPVRYDYSLFGLGIQNIRIPPHFVLNEWLLNPDYFI